MLPELEAVLVHGHGREGPFVSVLLMDVQSHQEITPDVVPSQRRQGLVNGLENIVKITALDISILYKRYVGLFGLSRTPIMWTL